ncbi:MAG: carbohydrate-binding domain-containing protein [Coprobacillus sp.]|nr:carbohydrate-binding domain-containing protein [Coprobacillus sp.]
MKKCLTLLLIIPLLVCGCAKEKDVNSDTSDVGDSFISDWTNPGDYLGGNGTVEDLPIEAQLEVSEMENVIEANTFEIEELDTSKVSEDAIEYTDKIKDDNNYVLQGDIDSQIEVGSKGKGAHIYLNGVNLTCSKKAMDIGGDITLVLVDGTTNYITATDESGKNCIDGDDASITILGSGTLIINSTKKGIVSDKDIVIGGSPVIEINSVEEGIQAKGQLYIAGGTYKITTEEHALKGYSVTILGDTNIETETTDKDGIHAEMKDDVSEFTYEDGYVYIDTTGSISLTTTGSGDGIQADTFVYIKNGDFSITTNGGAPKSASSSTANRGDGKAIKAGTIDYEIDNAEYELDSIYDYTICILGGSYDISANDDGLHSNGKLYLVGGDYTIKTGDDAIHAETDLIVVGGTIYIEESYEGVEAQVIQIDGGVLSVVATDDGINAASVKGAQADKNCQIIINDGVVYVDAQGDGMDSNGYIYINGGSLAINGPSSNMDAAIDSEYGILVTGGNFLACGSLGMVETPASNSTQYVISFGAQSSISSGTYVSIRDKSDNEIIGLTTARSYRSIMFSSPSLKKGETYYIYGGDKLLVEATISGIITSVGTTRTSGGGGTPGGGNMMPHR